MTSTNAELLLASKNTATGSILYTYRLTFPRIILAETLTHRAASRNTSSTRAIPTQKIANAVSSDMFVPAFIGANQKGMQAGKELTGFRRRGVIALWKAIGHASVLAAKAMSKLGAHKQVAGRVLEPYSWCTQIFSATDVENLFTLRNHVDAEPHFHELARQMERQARIARETLRRMDEADITFMQTEGATAYQLLEPGEWHLPLVTEEELFELDIEEAKRVSAARCARTSYTLLGKLIPKLQEDLELCHKLFGSTPMHLSPTEHQAQATPVPEYYGNFRGFKQFRKEIPGENVDNGTRTVNSLGGVYINMEEVKLILDLNKGYILGKKPALFMKELQDAYENQN